MNWKKLFLILGKIPNLGVQLYPQEAYLVKVTPTMKKKWSIPIIGSFIAGLLIALYLYNKPHPNLASQKADIQVSSTALFQAFEADETAANDQYLNTLIEVEGKVAEKNATEDGGYTLVLGAAEQAFGVNCAFLPADSEGVDQLAVGDQVTIKGICAGMLMDVNLSRCILVSP